MRLKKLLSILNKTKYMWKTITNYPDYKINEFGEVQSNKFKKDRLLKPQKDKYGYFNIRISNQNGFRTIKLHKLMAIEYLNHIPNGNTIVVDHIDNDGHKHRKGADTSHHNIYYWLVRNNFPTGFQILCMNCNQGKHRNNGVCPHKSKMG